MRIEYDSLFSARGRESTEAWPLSQPDRISGWHYNRDPAGRSNV